MCHNKYLLFPQEVYWQLKAHEIYHKEDKKRRKKGRYQILAEEENEKRYNKNFYEQQKLKLVEYRHIII